MIGRRAAAEAIGTFFIVFIGTGAIMVDDHQSGAIGPLGIALAFGLVVMAMVQATRHLSGAHLNPAVTVALWARGRIAARHVPPYVFAQLAGATAASFVLAAVRSELGPRSLGVTSTSVGAAGGLGVEFVLTFALMFVILATAVDAHGEGVLAALAIGAVVAVDALVGGPLTGASMNPARSFGPALVEGVWDDHWIYWAGPIAGALAAVAVHALLRGGDGRDEALG